MESSHMNLVDQDPGQEPSNRGWTLWMNLLVLKEPLNEIVALLFGLHCVNNTLEKIKIYLFSTFLSLN